MSTSPATANDSSTVNTHAMKTSNLQIQEVNQKRGSIRMNQKRGSIRMNQKRGSIRMNQKRGSIRMNQKRGSIRM